MSRLYHFSQPALGTKGELMRVDTNCYLIKDVSEQFTQASEQVNFTSDQTVVKMTFWIDGQPWVQALILMEEASTQAGPFVILN